MKNILTKRQKQLLSIIYKYIKNSGYPPSFEEMRQELNVASNQSIKDLLNKLVQIKVLKKEEGQARSLNILPLGYKLLGYKLLGVEAMIPYVGSTTAGLPTEMVEIKGEWLEMGQVAQFKDPIFLLKVKGDSMINAGIDDGDMVLVKSDKEFVSGDIVLAQIGDSSTIKRFMSDDKPPYVYLKPENPNYSIMPFKDDFTLIGKVVQIIKNSKK